MSFELPRGHQALRLYDVAPPVYLERIDPARRMARFYRVLVLPTLFGDWAMVRQWGRIGTAGQQRELWFESGADALKAAEHAATRKIRGGYMKPHERRQASGNAAIAVNRRSMQPPKPPRLKTDHAAVFQGQRDLDLA